MTCSPCLQIITYRLQYHCIYMDIYIHTYSISYILPTVYASLHSAYTLHRYTDRIFLWLKYGKCIKNTGYKYLDTETFWNTVCCIHTVQYTYMYYKTYFKIIYVYNTPGSQLSTHIAVSGYNNSWSDNLNYKLDKMIPPLYIQYVYSMFIVYSI
jgi:hypothetical protein